MLSSGISRSILSGALIVISTANSYGDWFDSFIKYECIPEIGYFKISDEGIRGRENVENLDSLREQLAEKGIFSGIRYGSAPLVYHEYESLGDHKVETIITMYAPTRSGYGGSNSTSYVEIRIDGVEKVSCHIGYYAPFEQTIDFIRIAPDDEEIYIVGSKGDDDIAMTVDFSEQRIITDESFAPKTISVPDDTESTNPEEDAAFEARSERMIDRMQAQIMEYLVTVGTASVTDIWENTFGMDSVMYVALFNLRKEGKVSWPGGENEGLSLSVLVTLVEVASSRA